MGVRNSTAFTTTSLANPAGGPSNTIIATTPSLELSFDGAAVLLFWYIKFTTGATGPVVSYNLIRGTTTAGTILNASVANATEVGAVGMVRSGLFIDGNPGVSVPQYSLGFNMANAGTAVTINEVMLLALVL